MLHFDCVPSDLFIFPVAFCFSSQHAPHPAQVLKAAERASRIQSDRYHLHSSHIKTSFRRVYKSSSTPCWAAARYVTCYSLVPGSSAVYSCNGSTRSMKPQPMKRYNGPWWTICAVGSRLPLNSFVLISPSDIFQEELQQLHDLQVLISFLHIKTRNLLTCMQRERDMAIAAVRLPHLLLRLLWREWPVPAS